MTEHSKSSQGNLGMFDAPAPWGPWTVVRYMRAFGAPNIQASTFFWNFSNKWLSADGRQFILVFTGVGSNDSWNTVRGSFDVSESPELDSTRLSHFPVENVLENIRYPLHVIGGQAVQQTNLA